MELRNDGLLTKPGLSQCCVWFDVLNDLQANVCVSFEYISVHALTMCD